MSRIVARAVLLVLALTASVLAIAGCGSKTVTAGAPTPAAKAAQSSPAPPAVKQQASLPCPPPPGTGVPGACTPKPVQVFGGTKVVPKIVPATVDPHVCIPDVSSWQGAHVDWGAVKTWQLQHGCKPAGIFKMGEYITDPDAWTNNSQLLSHGMWRAGYWFLRRTGCVSEGQQIVSEANQLKLRVVEEDDETAEAAGYDGCITAYIHKYAPDLIVGEYASPGAYPGGTRSSNPAWIAAYGPLNPPSAPWGGPIVAYQCTDGVFGCVTDVPGLGRGDMSVDYGITSEGVAPPPDPYRGFPKTKFHLAFDVVASEYNTIKAWDDSHCRNPVRRPVCKSTHYHIELLRDRVWFVVHHQVVKGRWVTVKTPRWSAPNDQQPLGSRFAAMSHDLAVK